MRFRCDRCGADHRPAKDPFTAAVVDALRKPGDRRVVRLPLTPP
jgi:hypothetical protein